jgi:oligosaccharide repeat unit polymerase
MTVFVAFLLGLVGIFVSYIVFHKWFNHVSLYTAIWSGTIMLFEWRLIEYYPFGLETWVVVVGCWLIFIIGAMTVVACKAPLTGNTAEVEINADPADDKKRLKRLFNALRVLNAVSFLVAIYHLYLVSRLAGGLSNAFILGNLLYSFRVAEEGLPGRIPYISSLVYTAALLAGSYTALKEKVTLISVLPFVIIIMIDFANMGRADILTVALLFAVGYFLSPRRPGNPVRGLKTTFRKLAIVLVVAAVVIGGADFIRSTRKIQEGFRGSTTALKQLRSGSIITPSIYLYLTASHGVLNRYIQGRGEDTPIGGNSFLPVYRILEGVGLDVHADAFQPWYKTPVLLNTGTYLRELHADFGLPGILIGPYVLGVLCSLFWYRIQRRRKYSDLAVGGFLFTIVGMGFFVMATRVSPVFAYFFVSLAVSRYLDWEPSEKVLHK